MDLTLVVMNFLGFSDSTTVRIKKLSVPAPTVHVTGALIRTEATTSRATELQTIAVLPAMSCMDTSLMSESMTYRWSELTGKLGNDLMATFATKSPTVLFIPPRILEPLSTYEFELVVFVDGDDSVKNNSARVVVQVRQEELVARIAGGALKQVGHLMNDY